MQERQFCGLRGSCLRRNDGIFPMRACNPERLLWVLPIPGAFDIILLYLNFYLLLPLPAG